MSEFDTRKIVQKLITHVQSRYVFPHIAEQICALLSQKLEAGEYSDVESEKSLAKQLTADLRSINQDRHLGVYYDPKLVESMRTADPTDRPQDAPEREDCGFEEVRITEEGIGYLKLREFADTKVAGDLAVEAMQKLVGAKAIIIDLRQNGGGSPKMVQLLTTYLFDHEPVHLNNFYMRETDSIDQFWTLPYVPGERLTDKPVFVLTSVDTFSAAEEFSYNLQNLKRATIIGAATGGGAHPGDDHILSDVLTTFIPHGRAINPITGTNWEGTGVKPDVEVDPAEALDVAVKKVNSLFELT